MEINNLWPRYSRTRNKIKWLVFIQYPNGKHHLFFVNETERQMLRRIRTICFDASDKIAYMDVYIVDELPKETRLNPYGEYNYRLKKLPNDNGEPSIKLPLKVWERIADACISVADYNLITESIKDDLRKTYYQIKAETR